MVEGMFSFFFVCILKITDLKCRCEVSCCEEAVEQRKE